MKILLYTTLFIISFLTVSAIEGTYWQMTETEEGSYWLNQTLSNQLICYQYGDCILNNLTLIGGVFNVSVSNYNVTGDIHASGNVFATNLYASNISGFLNNEIDPYYFSNPRAYYNASTLTEADTLQSVTNRGNVTNNLINLSGGIRTTNIIPLADSAGAINITKADGTTAVQTIDTTNVRIGIGTTSPSNTLHVKGDTNGAIYARIENANAGASAVNGIYMVNNNGIGGVQQVFSSTYGGGLASTYRIRTDNAMSGGIIFDTGTAGVSSGPIQFKTAGTTRIYIGNETNPNVGIGTTAPSYKLHISETDTKAGGTRFVTGQYGIYNPSTNDTTVLYAVADYKMSKIGANSAGSLRGLRTTVENGGGGNISTAISNQAFISNVGTGTIADGRAFYATKTASALNPITNMYGLYMDDLSGAGVTNAYGVYQLGSSTKNHFAGYVGMGGVTSPTTNLDVSYSSSASTSKGILLTNTHASGMAAINILNSDSTGRTDVGVYGTSYGYSYNPYSFYGSKNGTIFIVNADNQLGSTSSFVINNGWSNTQTMFKCTSNKCAVGDMDFTYTNNKTLDIKDSNPTIRFVSGQTYDFGLLNSAAGHFILQRQDLANGNTNLFITGKGSGLSYDNKYIQGVAQIFATDLIGNTTNTESINIEAWNNSGFGIFSQKSGTGTQRPITLSAEAVTRPNMKQLYLDTDGDVGINTVSPSYKLDVNGTMRATNYTAGTSAGITGSYNCTSFPNVTITGGIITAWSC